jgi:hypothetical protein
MANPNLVNVTSIYGKTKVLELSSNSTSILSNASASNALFKINSIIAANITGSTDRDVTVTVANEVGFAGVLASTITVPADSSLVVVGKDTPVYLEEGWSILANASAFSSIKLLISYEVISDV